LTRLLRFLCAALGALAAAAAFAQTAPRAPIAGRAELTGLFADHTFYGRYAGGSNFVEYYAPDGRLAYWDGCPHSGRWWIEGATACFHYPTMLGGNTFCFDVYRAPSAGLEFRTSGSDPLWIADAYTSKIAPGNPENMSLSASGCQISELHLKEREEIR
jgi:hypothetical protein